MVPGSYGEYPGSYADYSLAPAWRLVKLPDTMDFRSAAAILFQGLTAHFLAHTSFSLKPEHTVLIHGGAGGVGLLLTQIAGKIGATVYTTVSSETKAELSRGAGAAEAIVYSTTDFEAEIKRLTAGRGVDVVYDPIGKSTFDRSLNCLAIHGHLVLFGLASGPVGPVDPALLLRGSYSLTRPAFGHYVRTREEVLTRSNDIFRWLAQGELKLTIDRVFALKEAAQAHRLVEAGKTMGKVLLQP
jgi:NADPH2:quinone reductase